MSKISDQFADQESRAYGYARISHSESFKQGDSLPSQHERISTYYETKLKKEGVKWGGVKDDGTNVSAYKVPFHSRPAGKEILKLLKPGDHLILDKVDRIWRSLEDFVHLMKIFKQKRINVHIVNFLGGSIQNNTPMGDFTLRLFVLIAELDSTIKSERTTEALDQKRKRGIKLQFTPPGCKASMDYIDGELKRVLTWCDVTRDFMSMVVYAVDELGLSEYKAYEVIEQHRINLAKAHPDVEGLKREPDHYDVLFYKRLYQYEAAYQYMGISEPSQIPKRDVIDEATRQHKRVRTERRIKLNPHKYSKKKSATPVVSPEQLMSL